MHITQTIRLSFEQWEYIKGSNLSAQMVENSFRFPTKYHNDIKTWAEENIHNLWYIELSQYYSFIYFKEFSDAMAFKIKWMG